MRLGVLRGFAVDVALSSVGALLGWHPVWDFLHAHPEVVSWGVGALHIALMPVFFSQIIGGHAKSDDFMTKDDAHAHARAWTWSVVGTLGTSFIVPFVCTLMGRRVPPIGFLLAVVFAPFVSFVGPMLAVLTFPKLATKDIRVPNLLHGVAGAVVTVLTAGYLVLQETTMFFALESTQQVAGLVVFLGFFFAYLPVRLFLFYATAVDRRELVSVLASFALVGLQLSAR